VNIIEYKPDRKGTIPLVGSPASKVIKHLSELLKESSGAVHFSQYDLRETQIPEHYDLNAEYTAESDLVRLNIHKKNVLNQKERSVYQVSIQDVQIFLDTHTDDSNDFTHWAFHSDMLFGQSLSICRFIPMLDFSIPSDPENINTVSQALKMLGLNKGYLLDSGASYHFYGTEFFDDWGEYFQLYYQAMLLPNIIDTRWVANRLMLGNFALRYTPKKGIVPTVVKVYA
jgi:hypothetical protein